MPFTIDFRDEDVLAWTVTDDGARCERIDDWTPTFRVQAHADDASLRAVDDLLAPDPRVVDLRVESWRPGFRHDLEPVLAVDVDRVDAVRDVARRVSDRGAPGAYRCFDVDVSPQFRFCLERGVSPAPDADLAVLELGVPETELADLPITAIRIEPDPASARPGVGDVRPETASASAAAGERGSPPTEPLAGDALPAGGAPSTAGTPPTDETPSADEPPPTDRTRVVDGTAADVATAVADALATVDPDVLVLSSSSLVPALDATAEAAGVSLRLGRDPADYGESSLDDRPEWRQLAGESTYESYGNVGHSPARYGVPGRAIVDRSNTFFYHQGGLPGCLDLVARSHKPLQELAWASIGNVLTAIQIRHARHEEGVLTPWRSWRHELPKSMAQLHDADRGGHTFAPRVGVFEDVHELDFQSLYPNVIVEYNLSPETVCCDCHASRADVPGLGYAVCGEDGYLPVVLEDLVDDRAAVKAAIPDCDDLERRARLQGRSDAIKWILVSCFGYQGFSNAKFGRIECHEAINAFAREILLDAQHRLEDGGWELIHGIVDSLWVRARGDAGCGETGRIANPESLEDLCVEITEELAGNIPLEYEGAFEWIAFVPMRDSEAGALTKYFGKRADPADHEDAYKLRGIECRQRSTPAFVADAQEAMIEAYDRERTPEAVCRTLAAWIDRLERGDVDPTALLVTTSTSKPLEAYEQYTRTVAALERARDAGLDPSPGQDVRFVVTDDDARSRDRVRLAHEIDDGRDDGQAGATCDVGYYREQLVRAAESVVSPMGWRRGEVETFLANRTDASLASYGT